MSLTLTPVDETVRVTPPSSEGQRLRLSTPATPVTVSPVPAPSKGLVVPVAGSRGDTAYELAVRAGFVGTEEEWLASLVGPPGTGANYFLLVNFASASDLWRIDHGQNTYGLTVATFDHNGDPVEGDVRWVSPDAVEIHWFYPMTGFARIYN